jgi:hypothetical protein
MVRVTQVSAPRFRELHIHFSDGVEGSIQLGEEFQGVAAPLNDPHVFATVHVIDDGYGIGFDGCEYDMCAEQVHREVLQTSSVAA